VNELNNGLGQDTLTLLYCRVRARDAWRRVMRWGHQSGSTGLKAV
jgi:hypothetical protein